MKPAPRYNRRSARCISAAPTTSWSRPVIIERGKKPADMKNPDDYYEIVEVVPGAGLMQAPDAFGCKLGGYT